MHDLKGKTEMIWHNEDAGYKSNDSSEERRGNLSLFTNVEALRIMEHDVHSPFIRCL